VKRSDSGSVDAAYQGLLIRTRVTSTFEEVEYISAARVIDPPLESHFAETRDGAQIRAVQMLSDEE